MGKFRNKPENIIDAAKEAGWSLYKNQPEIFCLIFRRGDEQLNVYYSKMTVASTVNHPKQGRNQMFRRNVSDTLLLKLFDKPRTHTWHRDNAGYRRREDRP